MQTRGVVTLPSRPNGQADVGRRHHRRQRRRDPPLRPPLEPGARADPQTSGLHTGSGSAATQAPGAAQVLTTLVGRTIAPPSPTTPTPVPRSWASRSRSNLSWGIIALRYRQGARTTSRSSTPVMARRRARRLRTLGAVWCSSGLGTRGRGPRTRHRRGDQVCRRVTGQRRRCRHGQCRGLCSWPALVSGLLDAGPPGSPPRARHWLPPAWTRSLTPWTAPYTSVVASCTRLGPTPDPRGTAHRGCELVWALPDLSRCRQQWGRQGRGGCSPRRVATVRGTDGADLPVRCAQALRLLGRPPCTTSPCRPGPRTLRTIARDPGRKATTTSSRRLAASNVNISMVASCRYAGTPARPSNRRQTQSARTDQATCRPPCRGVDTYGAQPATAQMAPVTL